MNLAFTICANNYLAGAITLGNSFLRYHPDFVYCIVIADKQQHDISYPSISGIKYLYVADFLPEKLVELSAKFTVIEFCTAVKAPAFKYLATAYPGVSMIYYIDPDIFFYDKLPDYEDHPGKPDIILTPHFTSPVPLDNRKPDERLALNYGVFNLGFLGLRTASKQFSAFIEWWQERVFLFGKDDTANGCFTDQLWLNLAPVYFDRVFIEKKAAMNMAPWNLHERSIIGFDKNGKPLIGDGRPLIFYHFSRYKFTRQTDEITYYDRFPLDQHQNLLTLYHQYKALLYKNNFETYKASKPVYGEQLTVDQQQALQSAIPTATVPLQQRIWNKFSRKFS